MSVFLATLCLNEMEWLPKLYLQHKDWPGLVHWVFVEAADKTYAEANPQLVSESGLSVDGTSEYLKKIASENSNITYIPHGISDHKDPSLCKINSRRRYMEIARKVNPDFLIVLDADEFYTKEDQHRLIDWMERFNKFEAYVFPKREIWRPPAISDLPLFRYEAVGYFWDMACCHWFRWSPDIDYRECHNMPQHADGKYLNDNIVYWDNKANMPQMIHMGYAAKKETRTAKIDYYNERGENTDPSRRKYTKCRKAWKYWRFNTPLPYEGEVIGYKGPVPEVFQ